MRNSPDTLLIREAKFHKSRIAPLHNTTTGQLRVYAGHRELMGYGRETSAFFTQLPPSGAIRSERRPEETRLLILTVLLT